MGQREIHRDDGARCRADGVEAIELQMIRQREQIAAAGAGMQQHHHLTHAARVPIGEARSGQRGDRLDHAPAACPTRSAFDCGVWPGIDSAASPAARRLLRSSRVATPIAPNAVTRSSVQTLPAKPSP